METSPESLSIGRSLHSYLFIHDLKQAIKTHDRKVSYETETHGGQLNDETVNDHESLYDQYQSLEHRLLDLREEFNGFLERAQ